MTSYVTPKKNAAYIFWTALIDQSNVKLFKAAPTLATGDFKVSIDGGTFNDLGTLPTVTPAAGRGVKISLAAGEMNGDNIQVQCVDAAGAEWCDQFINIQTSARQVDDVPTATENADALLARDMSLVAGAAGRSPLNAMRKSMNKVYLSPDRTLLTITKEDDSTVAFEQLVTADASADPIVGLDTV